MNLIIRYALELMIIVPSAILALLPVMHFFKYKRFTTFLSAFVMCILLVIIGSLLCARFQKGSVYILYPAMILFFVAYYFFVELNIFKKIFCFLNAAMLCDFCTFYTIFLMAPYEVKNESLPLLSFSGLLCLGMASLTIILFSKVLTVKLPVLLRESYLDNIWKYLCLIPCLSIVMFNWVYPKDVSLLFQGRLRMIGLVLSLLIPVLSMSFYQVMWLIAKQTGENALLYQELHILRLERKRHAALRNYMTRTRALRHDFRQHLRVLDQLSRDQDTDKLMAYIHNIIETAGKSDVRYCANTAADAIASYYAVFAERYRIRINWDLLLPEVIPVQDTDFCALFGNLLENAILAVKDLPEEDRYINVSARLLSEEMLGLNIENPYKGKIRMGHNSLPRSKKMNGGVGLPSVSKTVRKYHGTMNLNTDNNLFEVGILLYAREEKDAAAKTAS